MTDPSPAVLALAEAIAADINSHPRGISGQTLYPPDAYITNAQQILTALDGWSLVRTEPLEELIAGYEGWLPSEEVRSIRADLGLPVME